MWIFSFLIVTQSGGPVPTLFYNFAHLLFPLLLVFLAIPVQTLFFFFLFLFALGDLKGPASRGCFLFSILCAFEPL